jgi:hypothetical protein
MTWHSPRLEGVMLLLGIGDLGGPGGRWLLSREGARQWSLRPDFPTPLGTISRGRVKVWLGDDIALYETQHPELLCPKAKRLKGWLAWRFGARSRQGAIVFSDPADRLAVANIQARYSDQTELAAPRSDTAGRPWPWAAAKV